jgi:hypothetical protein
MAEPLNQFCPAVWKFQVAASSHKSREPHAVAEFQETVAHHLRRAHPIPVLDSTGEGRWRSVMVFPSLLSVAYWMLLYDVTQDRAPRRCANEKCSTTFTPSRSDKVYCSPRCYNQQTQREHRRRLKERIGKKAAPVDAEGSGA